MTPRFEIVRTDAGYHALLKGGNGETVWTTEVYTRLLPAQKAITLLADEAVSTWSQHKVVKFVDERTP